jgi:HK97 gp10 family phage protein
MLEARLEGTLELSKQLRELAKAGDPEKVEPILMKGAKKLAGAIKERAPEGPTGNLKRSIKAKKLKPYGNEPAPAIAAVDRKIAPHAYLVENGTSRAPAHPFFRTAVDATLPEVEREVVADLTNLVEKAVR